MIVHVQAVLFDFAKSCINRVELFQYTFFFSIRNIIRSQGLFLALSLECFLNIFETKNLESSPSPLDGCLKCSQTEQNRGCRHLISNVYLIIVDK